MSLMFSKLMFADAIYDLNKEKESLIKESIKEYQEILNYKINLDKKINENTLSSNVQFKKEFKLLNDNLKKASKNLKRNLKKINIKIKNIDKKIERIIDKEVLTPIVLKNENIIEVFEETSDCYDKVSKNNKTDMLYNIINCQIDYENNLSKIIVNELYLKNF